MLGEPHGAREALTVAVDLLRDVSPRSLGAALFVLGQVEGMLGNGTECGEALGEALVIAASLGLPEQATIRAAIERLHRQAEASEPDGESS